MANEIANAKYHDFGARADSFARRISVVTEPKSV